MWGYAPRTRNEPSTGAPTRTRPVAPIGSGAADSETEGTKEGGSEEDALPLDVAGAGADVQATDSSSASAILADRKGALT
jgi:hypothetical protein